MDQYKHHSEALSEVVLRFVLERSHQAQKLLILLLLSFTGMWAQSQPVYLLRHMGGSYLTDPVYQIDLFNPSKSRVNLAGYTLITRQFVARFPVNTWLEPQQAFILGKGANAGTLPDLRFEEIPDFLVRIPRDLRQGDYLILLNRQGKPLDAFYYAPSRSVAYLPDSDTLITYSQRKIPFDLPGESASVWQYLTLSPDPALAFMRVEGRWQAGSRTRNTFPAMAYNAVAARYVDGVITIETSTQFERDALRHRLERSEDGINFSTIERFATNGSASDYRVYDPDIEDGKRYYYRFVHTDRFGFNIRSRLVEVRAEARDADLSLEPFVTNTNQLNIRLFTRTDQPIRLTVIDEQGRQWAVRFYDELQSGGRYLLRFDETIPQGRYRVIAATASRRYYETFMVQ
ncbi:MAG: hypothetical protein AB8F95_06530 [Bacteroidia bacterium]